MTFSEKIEEWIKEAETRPGSGLMILKLIAGRLRDLTERNEELLAENIALQDGTRVDEYQKRIAFLEFQLDLLKRRFGSDFTLLVEESSDIPTLLVYNSQGRIFRLESQDLSSGFGQVSGELSFKGESSRLLILSAKEEVLLLFSSGRISTLAVSDIPILSVGGVWKWDQAALPDEPHAGELLVCLVALSRMPVAEFILQVSRRGCVKKTTRTISEKVLADRYLGRGAIQKSDQPFALVFGDKKSLLVVVTYEGRVLVLDVADLSFAIEERIHLNPSDHVVAAFVPGMDETLLCLTQSGKVIEREFKGLEVAKAPTARGLALISPARLEQGTRFIGAVSTRKQDSLLLLDGQGRLIVHSVKTVSGAGSVQATDGCLAIEIIPFVDAKEKGI